MPKILLVLTSAAKMGDKDTGEKRRVVITLVQQQNRKKNTPELAATLKLNRLATSKFVNFGQP